MSATENTKANLGTSAVFFTAISTILGAIMFLRFGFAVGNVGFINTILIVVLGHMITIPTAMAIAEIATNQKVEGGGEYYIISRSFGLNIGGTIGVALFLSQAISVAFYTIAFAQAFDPIFRLALIDYDIVPMFKTQTVTIPTTLFLVFIILRKGASIGLKLLYFVVAILGISLVLFFLGTTEYSHSSSGFPTGSGLGNFSFFHVFAICFPGFTGMTAGVGLSGDLKNPSKAIPLGTLSATIIGMLIYIGIVWKLAVSASPHDLDSNQLVMGDIALFGSFVIPLGLAAATFSSAIGSIIVAPRTLQALGMDNILPSKRINQAVAKNKKGTTEPVIATLVTSVLAIGIVLINDVDFVAEIISIFFMITYGVLCAISFLEHFAADPAYRPSFKSKWYLSLGGAVLCFVFMFQMNFFYSVVGLLCIAGIYFLISLNKQNSKGIARIFQGVISQLSRQLQVFLQKVEKDQSSDNWRPSIICLSQNSFERFGAFDLLRWISAKYGFGTYIHRIDGYLSKETHQEAKKALDRLIKIGDNTKSNIFLDTMVSPSFTAAVSQVVQLPGISGKENNMALFEFKKDDSKGLSDIVDNLPLIKSSGFDACLLSSSIRNFGFKRQIDIWITSNDYANANLMILMGYIILGHKEWAKGNIRIFALYPEEELQKQKEKLSELIHSGRLPISQNNIELITKDDKQDDKVIINNRSADADLVIMGFSQELVKHNHEEVFLGYDKLGDMLFLNTSQTVEIK